MGDKRHYPTDPKSIARARTLRVADVPAEHLLWQRLRARRIAGWKFRRQVPLAGFIADFYCHELKLVIELDGNSHVEAGEADSLRTEHLARNGYVVIRFWNTYVFENIDGVVQAIYAETVRLSGRDQAKP